MNKPLPLAPAGLTINFARWRYGREMNKNSNKRTRTYMSNSLISTRSAVAAFVVTFYLHCAQRAAFVAEFKTVCVHLAGAWLASNVVMFFVSDSAEGGYQVRGMERRRDLPSFRYNRLVDVGETGDFGEYFD